MLKTVHIPSKILTFLIATSLMVVSLKTALLADGSPLLFSSDSLKDPGSLAVKLQDTRASLSKSLTLQLSAKTQQLLTEYNGTSLPSSALQKELLADLNRLIQEGSLYDDQHFASIPLSEQTQKLLAQNPENGEDLIRLNRFLLADAYPQELVSPAEKQSSEDSKGIETCRKNLRQIKLALENYRAKAGTEPQWLSELSPEHLEKKVLLCPADATQGKPGVLTEGAEDPTLPCSYLYEFRPEQKGNQEILLGIVGNMLPIVRCQHHFLNLSISGKLYRNGPKGDIYNSVSNVKITGKPQQKIGEPQQKMFHIRSQEDLAALHEQLGDAFFETEDGKALLKRFAKQPSASNPSEAPSIVNKQSVTGEPQQQKMFYIRSQEDLAAVREQLGDAFFETEDGKALLKRFAKQSHTFKKTEAEKLIGSLIPDIAFRNLSGEPVKLKQFRGKFVLLNLFSTDSISCGPDLQRLEKHLKNTDAARLQAIGISTDDPVKAITEFKEKYQISIPLWVDEKSEILGCVYILNFVEHLSYFGYPVYMKHTENTQKLPIEISDEVWEKIHPFLVACPNVYVGNPQHCRVFLSAVLWITKEGATWRALPDAYGNWNAIYRRFSRWADAGVFETLQQHFHADAEVSTVFIDSTIVRANASAAGAPKKRGTRGASTRSQLWRFLNENKYIVEREKYPVAYHVDSRTTS